MKNTLQLNQLHNFHIFYYETSSTQVMYHWVLPLPQIFGMPQQFFHVQSGQFHMHGLATANAISEKMAP